MHISSGFIENTILSTNKYNRLKYDKINKYTMKRTMQNMKKSRIMILSISVLFVIAIIITGVVFIISKKDDSANNYEIHKKDVRYLKDDGQVIETKDYTFTLEKYYFEPDINVGHCLISITQDGKKGKDIDCLFNIQEFVNNEYLAGHYYLNYMCDPKPGSAGYMSTSNKKVSSKGDKKYIYFDFEIALDGFKDTLVIKNYPEEEDKANLCSEGVGTFKLEDNTEWRDFSDGEKRISVCHYGVKIFNGQTSDIENFELYMKNGKKHTIKEGDMRERTYEYKSETTQLRFAESIDINDIDYIRYNGKKYR